MSNWKSFGDRMLYCHRYMLKTWWNCSNPASFQYSSTLGDGGGCFKKAATFSQSRPSSSSSSSYLPPPIITRSLSSSPLLMLPPRAVVVDHNNSEKYYYSVDEDSNNNEDYFHFFNLSEQSQFRVRKNLRVPWQRDLLTPDAAPCVGSSHGWLAFNDPRNCHPYLYNPLIDSPDFPYIPLPSVETIPSFRGVRFLKSDHVSPSPSLIQEFLISLHQNNNIEEDTYERNLSSEDVCYYYVRRLVMSSAPSVPCYSSSSTSKPELDDNDCTIMAIHSGSDNIAFCKPGDHRWTVLDGLLRRYTDIIYFTKDQRFYAMGLDYSIEAWDLRDPSCPKNQVFDSPDWCPGKLNQKFADYNRDVNSYLVESSGDLLLLSRFIAVSVAQHGIPHPPRRLEVKVGGNNNDDEEEQENYSLHDDDDAYWTLGFDVYKFDFDHNKWEPVECLGDQALFVGSNQSFSLSTRDYPELTGNSIYFTDDYFEGFNKIYNGHDNGVFHLEDNCIKPYYPSRLKIIDPHPVWVAPNTM